MTNAKVPVSDLLSEDSFSDTKRQHVISSRLSVEIQLSFTYYLTYWSVTISADTYTNDRYCTTSVRMRSGKPPASSENVLTKDNNVNDKT